MNRIDLPEDGPEWRHKEPIYYVCLCCECGREFGSRQKSAKVCIQCFGEEDGPYLDEPRSEETNESDRG